MDRVIAAVKRALGAEALELTAEPMADSGEAVALFRLVVAGDPARSWVAKRLHPALRRESAAYRGPLAALDVAPRLLTEVEDDEEYQWIVLENAGQPLDPFAPEPWLKDAAALAARIHEVPPGRFRAPFWRRGDYIRHRFRHLRGEWKIALARVEEGVREGVLENDVAPADTEARRVLNDAWGAMRITGSGFVHGDFQALNMLRGGDGALRAVDWSQWREGSALLDLAAVAKDLSEEDRDRFVDAYLAQRGLEAQRPVWREGLARVLPLRQLLGVGVLAHYIVHGTRPDAVAASLSLRLAGWEASRRGAGAHSASRGGPAWS